MIYTTGTVAVSGNTLTGTGTNFTAAGSLIRIGCTVLTMTSPPQAFQITGITSATQMTVTPAASPALAAGTKYSILLSDSLSVDGLAQDIAETFSMYQRNISGFADVMNGTGDVTITVDGKPVTVPGQKSLAKKGANSDITSLTGLKTALSIAQGGTGATDAAGIRKNAGLSGFSSAAVVSANWNEITETGIYSAAAPTQPELPMAVAGLSVNHISVGPNSTQTCFRASASSPGMWRRSKEGNNSWGKWVPAQLAGDFGIGGSGESRLVLSSNLGLFQYLFNEKKGGCIFSMGANGGGSTLFPYAPSIFMRAADAMSILSTDHRTGVIKVLGTSEEWITSGGSSGNLKENTLYGTANTTKASDGTLKAASPVARIANPDSCTRPDIDENGFEWCGFGVANDEARGIEIIRDEIGVYRVTGAKSLASSGWRLLPPRDPDGSGDLGVVTAKQIDDEIIVSLFRRKLLLVDGEIVTQPGEPIDVPVNSWIDVRLDMPGAAIPAIPPLSE